ncbi:hypothetical protein, conserved [Babesia bigemina]|uniref:Uncharacterized protein n=1 Tax=Babesia bigemina TaxID=5866 RepID=A0A061DAC8_BABBI|nr:hypothetical protein, conserved [Babesia bigemina]CDR97661.1 hypothetical protein, conserved [Babesia bigemina]|eukprot:XP_012769847.1 hypothetical protein, conserved [Babesia bigemina]
MYGGIRRRAVKCCTAVLTLLYTVLAIIGIGGGIVLLPPLVRIQLPYEMPKALGTWHMKLDSAGNLITGSRFDFDITFYNPSLLPVAFTSQKAAFYFYPIGPTSECMKYHYKGEYVRASTGTGVISQLHREISKDTKDGLISIENLSVTIPPKRRHYDLYSTRVPVKAHFEVYRGNKGVLSALKPLYMDCVKYGAILLTLRIKEMTNRLWMLSKSVPVTYELLLPLRCEVQGSLAPLFSGPATFGVSMLQETTNYGERSDAAFGGT